MGAYGGTRESLLVTPTSQLKYYERYDIVNANRQAMAALSNVTNQRQP